MGTFLFIIRWTALLVLLWGAWSVLKRIVYLHLRLAPIITMCTITLLVYFGGLIGHLQTVTYLVIALCALCTGYEIYRRAQIPGIWADFPLVEGMFLLGVVAFGWILYSGGLVHYDNFTHWGLVVKEMLITHAFPTADSAMIEFTNYPTGTASWIYFACTIVGGQENCMVMAQGLLIFSAIYSIFGIIEEHGRFLLVIVLGSGLSLLTIFNFSVRINNLLVDFVLPMLTLSAISVIYSHRREPNVVLLSATPILGVLVIVKSSGIIFASLAMTYMVYVIVQEARCGDAHPWALCGKMAVAITLCVLPLVGWNMRVNQVFANVQHKFETDLSVVSAGIGGKTDAEVQAICRLFWESITDATERATMGIIIFQVSAMLACVIGCYVVKKHWALPRVLVVMDVVVVLYLLGILAMYLYSMPVEEAIYLAAFDRYSSSIVVLFGGVLSICLTSDIERSFHYRLGEVEGARAFKSVESKTLYLRGSVVGVMIMVVVLTSEFNGMVHHGTEQEDSLPYEIKAVVGDHWEPEVDDSAYLIYVDDADALVENYYIQQTAEYYLRATNVDATCDFAEDEFLDTLSKYDYLAVVHTTPQVQTLMEEYFGLSGDVGVYDLTNL